MVFSDPIFLFLFLPSVLTLYWLLGRRFRNRYIALVGTIFYMWSGGGFIFLLAAMISLTYLSGVFIYNAQNLRRKKLYLQAAITCLVCSLLFWKYSNFVVVQLSKIGLIENSELNLALPIAISFFTFQCISYVVDIYFARCKPSNSFSEFSAYILLFPHLIAGPIVRFSDIQGELQTKERRWVRDFEAGAPRFFWGLAKKILIADQVAVIANAAFALPDHQAGFASVWIGTLAFTVQIYFDFSGYSDMAIGLARMFGFTFLENFKRPYSSISVTDFWRRWHISLSSWFRDYVYIPLGGNRTSSARTYINLGTVFILTGLWHGANWTFLLWGIFHGTFLIFERVTGLWEGSKFALIRYLQRLATFVIVSIGWVLFRANDVSQAGAFYQRMVHFSASIPLSVQEVLTSQRLSVLAIALIAVLTGGPGSVGTRLSSGDDSFSDYSRIVVLVGLAPISLVYALSSDFAPFLYFQF